MKKLLALLLALVMVFALSACASQEQASAPAEEDTAQNTATAENETAEPDSTSPEEAPAIKIGLMLYAETDEATISIRTGVERAAAAAGVELVIASIENDYTKCNSLLDSFINQGCTAIIDATWSAEAGLATSARCKELGIPLVTCDVEYDDYAHLVGASNYGSGQINGDYVLNWVNENWDGQINYVIAMYTFAGGEGVKQRLTGCLDKLTEANLLTEDQIDWFDASNTEQAMQTVRDWLTAHPDADHIYIINNNDSGALGSYNAAVTMGREEDVMITSYNADSFALEHLATTDDSCWKGTVNFNLSGYGDLAVPALIEILTTGEDNIAHELNTQTFIIDRANVSEYYSG